MGLQGEAKEWRQEGGGGVVLEQTSLCDNYRGRRNIFKSYISQRQIRFLHIFMDQSQRK